jgi:hypothetical protein
MSATTSINTSLDFILFLLERIPITTEFKIVLPSLPSPQQQQHVTEIQEYDEDFDDEPLAPLQSQALASQRHMFRNGRRHQQQQQPHHRFGSLTQTVVAQHTALVAREIESQRRRRRQRQHNRRQQTNNNIALNTTTTSTTTIATKDVESTTRKSTSTIENVTDFFMRTGNRCLFFFRIIHFKRERICSF